MDEFYEYGSEGEIEQYHEDRKKQHFALGVGRGHKDHFTAEPEEGNGADYSMHSAMEVLEPCRL